MTSDIKQKIEATFYQLELIKQAVRAVLDQALDALLKKAAA